MMLVVVIQSLIDCHGLWEVLDSLQQACQERADADASDWQKAVTAIRNARNRVAEISP